MTILCSSIFLSFNCGGSAAFGNGGCWVVGEGLRFGGLASRPHLSLKLSTEDSLESALLDVVELFRTLLCVVLDFTVLSLGTPEAAGLLLSILFLDGLTDVGFFLFLKEDI